MADLLIIPTYRDNYGRDVLDATPDNPIRMRLYCWPCKDVHAIALDDVQRIVYALGAEAITAYEAGFSDGGENFGEGERIRLPEDPPQCLREVLRGAGDIEVYAEHVDQGIECRERADA